jgi:hypothetical protein
VAGVVKHGRGRGAIFSRLVFCVLVLHAAVSSGQENSWISGSGFWDTETNWSLELRPSIQQTALFVTNAVTKTVTIDDFDVNIASDTLTISNLTVSAPIGSVSTLLLNNMNNGTGSLPLHIFNRLTIDPNGVLVVTNSSLRVDGVGAGGAVPFAINGAVNVRNASIIATNNSLTTGIGQTAAGTLTVQSGTVIAARIAVGSAVAPGTLALPGGTTRVTMKLDVGGSSCAITGVVSVTGGNLFVTNSAGTAVMDIHAGRVTQTGGTIQVDVLVVTNACGRFDREGGTLMFTNLVLDANFDADGDGLPNGWEQLHMLDPLSSVGDDGPDGDPDGDGQNNLFEYGAGLDPQDANSVFRVRVEDVPGQPDQKNIIFSPRFAGTTYTVEYRKSLTSGDWQELTDIITTDNGMERTVTDLDALDSEKFYRVKITPP